MAEAIEKDLRARLQAFDGRHINTLEDIAATLNAESPVLSALCGLALSDEQKLQSGATWLLKRLAEKGGELDPAQTTALLSALARQSGWEAKLHILQMLDKLRIPGTEAAALWHTLEPLTGHKKRLLRAWAYHGLAVLGQQHTAYRGAAVQWLAQGDSDAAASVQARIRRLRQAYVWLRV